MKTFPFEFPKLSIREAVNAFKKNRGTIISAEVLKTGGTRIVVEYVDSADYFDFTRRDRHKKTRKWLGIINEKFEEGRDFKCLNKRENKSQNNKTSARYSLNERSGKIMTRLPMYPNLGR